MRGWSHLDIQPCGQLQEAGYGGLAGIIGDLVKYLSQLWYKEVG